MRRAAGLAICLLVAGCATAPGESLVALEPPADWEAGLERARHEKDAYFKTAADSPLEEVDRAGFEGLEYWPPDPSLYFVGSIRYHPQPEPVEMVTTAGASRPCEKVGWISFEKAGASYRLEVFRLLDLGLADGVEHFFLPFQDATTGNETYPAGRYLNLNGPPGGPYELDFNAAYNPSCAYGSPERFACPRTPPSNRLSLRVEAGERGYKPES